MGVYSLHMGVVRRYIKIVQIVHALTNIHVNGLRSRTLLGASRDLSTWVGQNGHRDE